MELISEQKRKEFIRLENSKIPYTPSENIMDYTGLVRGLNTELYERFGEVEKGFEYSTTGFMDAISFDGVLLWNSEMEVREWIEEKNDYEPFEPFIRRIFNEYIDRMHTLKF